MWLFSQTGFLSIVTAHDRPDHLTVRARARGDLSAIARRAGEEVVATPDRDYPWRIVAPRHVVGAWVAAELQALDYPNFKNRVAQAQGQGRAAIYADVWATGLRISREEDGQTF